MSRFDLAPTIEDGALHDVVLACACVDGRKAALMRFDREVMDGVDAAVRRVDARQEAAEEVRQELLVRLFVGDAPKIFEYRGTGPLASWVKVAAIRIAVDRGRKEDARERVSASLAEKFVEAPVEDPDLILLRKTHQGMVSGAVRAAAAELDARSRSLLKMQFVEGAGIDRIAFAYGVHRSTAARWIRRACLQLEERALAHLSSRQQLPRAEALSLARLFRTQLSVSFSPVADESSEDPESSTR
ncbi:MAG: hypothetical protein AAGA54_24365 [Myxococcota bacterium]